METELDRDRVLETLAFHRDPSNDRFLVRPRTTMQDWADEIYEQAGLYNERHVHPVELIDDLRLVGGMSLTMSAVGLRESPTFFPNAVIWAEMPDKKENALLIFHALAGTMLTREVGLHTESDRWVMTASLVMVDRILVSMRNGQDAAHWQGHVPVWFLQGMRDACRAKPLRYLRSVG